MGLALVREVFRICLLWAIPVCFSSTVVGPPIKLSSCWDAMRAADANKNWCLDRQEYFNFTKTLDADEDNVYAGINNASKAPLFWNQTWQALLLVCANDPNPATCTASRNTCLNVSTTPPSVVETNSRELYIFTVCWSTYAALRHSQESDAPSISPSAVPSSKPSRKPSSKPSKRASRKPTPRPTRKRTSAPTRPRRKPTASPTYSYNDVAITQRANLGFLNTKSPPGPDAGQYSDALVAMQDLMGAEVLSVLQNRFPFLILSTDQKPCTLVNNGDFACPANQVDVSTTVCQTINFTCYLSYAGQDTGSAYDIKFETETAWADQIDNGGYQTEINGIGAKIKVVSKVVAPPSPAQADTNLSPAVAGGVAAAAVVAVLIPFITLLFYRSRSKDDDKEKSHYKPYDLGEDPPNEIVADAIEADLYAGATQTRPASVLGATRPSYGGKGKASPSQKYLEGAERGEDILAEPEFDVERSSSSSNAGSSGWSSSAGYSSYNTGSMDDSMDAAMTNVTTLAAIGVSSSLTQNAAMNSSRTSNSITSDGQTSASAGSVVSARSISRDQLDNYIQAGDWAAVGATAALLAAASDSQSQSSYSRSRRSRGSSNESDSLEAARAAELDHLVDAGDWEGVILAAARFEAAETASSKGSRTVSSVDSNGSHTHTDDGGATGSSKSQSESATASDDPSRTRQLREVRSEVEALVRRVVPEEIDNVDEMMNQFKGREEELVETLRTMQERAIAQKARSAGHKTAKLEARKNVKRGYVPGARPPQPVVTQATPSTSSSPMRPSNVPETSANANHAASFQVAAADSTQNVSWSTNSNSGSGSLSNDSSTLDDILETKTALEKAIGAGDWEAVGQAAAFLGDASVGTHESGEIERTALSNVSTTSGSIRTRSSKDNESMIRAAELDEMINKNDWSGVVAAANRFSQLDKRSKSEVGRTPEEEEALAQAEFWTKLANQKKAQGANDLGASDAAEWAIQRSLSQLKEADRKREVTSNREHDEDEV